MGLHSQNTGKWRGCFPMARATWVRCHSPVFPLLQSQALLHPSTPTAQDLNCQKEVDYLSCACLGHLCQLEGKGCLARAVWAASLCGRLRPGVCTCLPGAYSVETEHRWLHRVGLQQATFFPLSANPLAQAYPPATFPQSLHLWIEAQAIPQHTSPSMMTSPL